MATDNAIETRPRFEPDALGRLAELRESLADQIRARASVLALRAQRDRLESSDIDAAWDAIVADKECDISAVQLGAARSGFAKEAIGRICRLKGELGRMVKGEAEKLADIRGDEHTTVTADDIDLAWDQVTYGLKPELRAAILCPENSTATDNG